MVFLKVPMVFKAWVIKPNNAVAKPMSVKKSIENKRYYKINNDSISE